MVLIQKHGDRVKILTGDIEDGIFRIDSLRFSKFLPENEGTFKLVMPGRDGVIGGVIVNRKLYPAVPINIHDLNNISMVS